MQKSINIHGSIFETNKPLEELVIYLFREWFIGMFVEVWIIRTKQS